MLCGDSGRMCQCALRATPSRLQTDLDGPRTYSDNDQEQHNQKRHQRG